MRIRVDAARPLAEEPGTGHNRWHPDLDPIALVRPGEEITLETRDGLDAQLRAGASHDAALGIDLGTPHPLTGPIQVEGAQPGDLLEVELLAYETAAEGVTCIVPGFGFLADVYAQPYVVTWSIEGGKARSPAFPGIAVPGDPFAGTIGIAPSHELMLEQRRREDDLRSRGGAVADQAPAAAVPASAAEGLRTIPPRETGGNLDVRQLVAGSRLFLEVRVPGALFSVGDLHFAQGDGETCGVAIEVSGAVTVRFGLDKTPRWRPRFPAYETPARVERSAFATTGLPVTAEGRNESLDLTLAARNAVFEMVEYLVSTRGLAPEAAYVLVSVACDLRLSEVVDVPNPAVSCLLPLDIFES
jgi:formamidase